MESVAGDPDAEAETKAKVGNEREKEKGKDKEKERGSGREKPATESAQQTSVQCVWSILNWQAISL